MMNSNENGSLIQPSPRALLRVAGRVDAMQVAFMRLANFVANSGKPEFVGVGVGGILARWLPPPPTLPHRSASVRRGRGA